MTPTNAGLLAFEFCFAACTVGLLAISLGSVTCTPQARSEADALVVDLTGAACNPLDPFDTSAVVAVICILAEGGEAVANALLDGGAPVVKTLTLSVPRSQVMTFCASHQGKDASSDQVTNISEGSSVYLSGQ
jgi:hypothetical protein